MKSTQTKENLSNLPAFKGQRSLDHDVVGMYVTKYNKI